MKKNYFLLLSLLTIALAIVISCGTDDSSEGEYEPVSPVVLDLASVPFDSLSKYKFFEGDMKNLQPAYGVLPYDLNSSLFTDYAQKKRFVWMPKGVAATYNEDGKVLDFPTGSILIKNFYYENTIPSGTTVIIETRLMIKKAEGWIFATYKWNGEQTEAVLNAGGTVRVAWNHNGSPRNINYKIPTAMDCYLCHRSNDRAVPIGPKPQNLNKAYNYPDGAENQLTKWVKAGYLAEGYSTNISTTIDWEDTTKPLELRVRSYLDANCAHCHTDGGQCQGTPLKLDFLHTDNPANLGVCIEPQDYVTGDQTHLVAKQNIEMSLLHFRMSTNDPNEMMPITGRTVIHAEALALIEEWINSMEGTCP
ncbi:hypothetical protein OGH69_16140 [Flavobacterium sp. MFBS3-15]|uniref:hypothetical protein n=1 Tax=Flavobacterium sp. MFBS3-15 TaxID=2989816 RepID=UPI0022365040|nr:hypothetical protein [Flavobacterium sp. MFBS3-15]MCW4470502.1 hypothetical protein [Flavobacterium sp. MFBS3-15]